MSLFDGRKIGQIGLLANCSTSYTCSKNELRSEKAITKKAIRWQNIDIVSGT
jgi:hypothetical protein